MSQHDPFFASVEDEHESPSEPPRFFAGAVFGLIFEAIGIAVGGVIYAIVRIIFG